MLGDSLGQNRNRKRMIIHINPTSTPLRRVFQPIRNNGWTDFIVRGVKLNVFLHRISDKSQNSKNGHHLYTVKG